MELPNLVSTRNALMRPFRVKSPIVHFALLGLMLFIGDRWLLSDDDPSREPNARIAVSESQVAALIQRYETASGKRVTPSVRAGLIQQFAEEEMLFREAYRWGLVQDNRALDLRLRQIMAFISDGEHSDDELERQARALGLDSKDAVIRNMLVHNMRLLLSTKGELEPSDEDVAAYYERERSRFSRPARMTGWHVFFSKDLRRSSAATAARAAQVELDARAREPEEAVGLGDVCPSGGRFEGQLPHQLAARFGDTFAEVAESLPEGQWSDPVETPFGAHLLLVQERTQPTTPPLSEIRPRVAAAYKSSQRRERLAAAMGELRARYEVVVE